MRLCCISFHHNFVTICVETFSCRLEWSKLVKTRLKESSASVNSINEIHYGEKNVSRAPHSIDTTRHSWMSSSNRAFLILQILCVHLKRFRHEFTFSSKISNYVLFPLEGLDMRPYLHKGFTKEFMLLLYRVNSLWSCQIGK